jgi:hypothetical protein
VPGDIIHHLQATRLELTRSHFILLRDHGHILVVISWMRKARTKPATASPAGVLPRPLPVARACAGRALRARHWVGRAVRVITDQGSLCAGRVADLRYIARVIPHHSESVYFQGLVDRWGEPVEMFEKNPPAGAPRA